MARQRFIWPSIWSDKAFGSLKPDEQILFVGLWSLADDEGRINADPAYLRGAIFPYKDYTVKKVLTLRNGVVERMRNVYLYTPDDSDHEAIQFTKWSEYQKPKYPSPSKIAPPNSGKVPGTLGEGSGNVPLRVGLDRDGMGRAVGVEGSTEQPSILIAVDNSLRSVA